MTVCHLCGYLLTRIEKGRFDTMMYLSNVREEHVVTYREAVKAARDFLDGIVIVTQGRLPRSLISDNHLREILGKVDAMVIRNYPDYV